MMKFGTFGTAIALGTVVTCSSETKSPLWYMPSEQVAAPYKLGYFMSGVSLFHKLLLKIITKINSKNRAHTRMYARIGVFWI